MIINKLITSFKEKVEFWAEVKNNLGASSLLLCKYGRTSDTKFFLKAWLFKFLNVRNMACNSI